MKKQQIKNKILNSLMCKGKKQVSEKILIKSLKQLHSVSIKWFQKILKLFLILTITSFNLYQIKKKRFNKNSKVFKILKTNYSWVFLAIKFILKYLKVIELKKHFVQLCQEFYLNAWNKGIVLSKKIIKQKKVLLNKKKFFYYRW